MQSEIIALITDQNEAHLALEVCRQPCVGCNGRCGVYFLASSSVQSISVSQPYFKTSPERFEVGNQVVVGVPVKTLIGLSLLVYLVPLVLMLLSTAVCFHAFSQSDGAIAISALFGLIGGLIVVRFLLAMLERNQASETLFIRHHPNCA